MGLSDAMRLAVNMARAFPATPITISQTGDWIEAVEDLERQLQRAEERADRNAAAVDAAERRVRQAEEQFDELSIITNRIQQENERLIAHGAHLEDWILNAPEAVVNPSEDWCDEYVRWRSGATEAALEEGEEQGDG